MMALVPAALALVFGYLAFRSRVTGVYLSIMTQALSYALMLAFFRNDMGFGGNNGFTDFKEILGFDLHADSTRAVLLVITAAALAASYWTCRAVVAPRVGRVVQAIRDAESRTRFLGYPVESYKLWLFVVSAVIAGVAGALYVPQVGIINPGEFAPINSIEVVIWVAVGGRGTLVRRGCRRRAGELCEDVFHRSVTGGVAIRARRAVRAGHPVSSAGPRRPAARTGERRYVDKILYLEKLTVSFDGFKALNALTLYVDPGELRCIIGPNGAGKTTMMDVITGKTRPDSGTAWFGRRLGSARHDRAGDCAVRYRPEVSEAHGVREPDRVRKSRARLEGKKSFWTTLVARSVSEQRDRIDKVLSITGLTRPARPGKILSHGQKQWLEIGMLLMQEPELLLVDEPVAGMTPQETERTAELLVSLAGEHSVVVVEHDMDFVRSIARRVTVLHEGSVLAEGDMDHVQNDPRVIEVYLGA